jgi:hypothetical protein
LSPALQRGCRHLASCLTGRPLPKALVSSAFMRLASRSLHTRVALSPHPGPDRTMPTGVSSATVEVTPVKRMVPIGALGAADRFAQEHSAAMASNDLALMMAVMGSAGLGLWWGSSWQRRVLAGRVADRFRALCLGAAFVPCAYGAGGVFVRDIRRKLVRRR